MARIRNGFVQFNFDMPSETKERLWELAKITERKPTQLLRYLINREWEAIHGIHSGMAGEKQSQPSTAA